MPNEIDAAGGGRARYDEPPSSFSGKTMTSSSSESEVDIIAKILDPFEQLERECNGEAAAMMGEQKLVKSDSDEGVVADDEGGDVAVLDGYVVCFMENEFELPFLFDSFLDTGVRSLIGLLKVGVDKFWEFVGCSIGWLNFSIWQGGVVLGYCANIYLISFNHHSIPLNL